MSSGFITEKDAGLERQKRQEEWEKVRQPSDPLEAPEPKRDESADARPLHEKLSDNKIREQEAILNQRALKNQIRGLNEDESQFLQVLKTAEQNEISARQREEEMLFNQLRRNQTTAGLQRGAEDGVVKATSSLVDTGKVKKQSQLLKNAVKRKGTDDNSNVQQKRPTTQIDNEKKILEAARKAKEILDSKKKEPEVTGLGLLVGQYSDSEEENQNSDTTNSDEDSDGLEISEFKQLTRIYTLNMKRKKAK
jgi:hypothetical protein